MKKFALVIMLQTLITANVTAVTNSVGGSPRMQQNKAITGLLRFLESDKQAHDAVLAYHVKYSPSSIEISHVFTTLQAFKKANAAYRIVPEIVEKAFMGATVEELIQAKRSRS